MFARRLCRTLVFGMFAAQFAHGQQSPFTLAKPSPTPVVFSPQTLADLKRLQQAALNSDYPYKQVAHLANNIGPRLSGSAQAARAVEYVASELKAIGCEVHLERVMVPHWVRGEETAALVQFPGEAENTTHKIVLCALGASVATPGDGITAEVVVAKNFDELKALPRDKDLRGRYLETSELAASYTHYLDTLNGMRRLNEIRRFRSLDYGAKRERILALMDSGAN